MHAREKFLKAAMNAAYRKGFEDAMREWAWWKDGEQRLGCGVFTLKDKLREVAQMDCPLPLVEEFM